MAEPASIGVRKNSFLTNARAIELTSDGVRAAERRLGRSRVAKASDKTTRTVEKWMAGASLPGIDDLLNIADEAPEVMRPLMGEKGWTLTPSSARPSEHMELAAGLGHSLTELIERLRDGTICHIDRAVLASLFRELIPAMQAVVNEDDALRKSA